MRSGGTDTNYFRYCGEYWDTETETYYLRARYYDPVLGRFTQKDTYRGDHKDPLSLNLYVYCGNNPIFYLDYTGNFWETAFDVISVVSSLVDVCVTPTPLTVAALAYDVGALFLPFVPGSGVAKIAIKAVDAADTLADTAKTLKVADKLEVFGKGAVVAPYKQLKKIMGGTGQEVHHLIEKRFIDNLNIKNANEILSVALDKETHAAITKEMRRLIPYSNTNKAAKTTTVKAQHIWSALRDTYIKLGHEDYLDILKEAFQQYGHNLDWDMTFDQAKKVVPLINGEMIK